jgi:hypothetical protein
MSNYPVQAQPAPGSPTSTLAIISLVSGILSWFMLPFVGGVAAVITGHMARGEIKSSQGAKSGDGLAVAGLILGYLHLVTFCLGILVFLLFFGGLVGLSGCAILSGAGSSGTSNIVIPPLPFY